MDEVTNADRAAWALSVLEPFVKQTRVDTASAAIQDLISNLLHLANGRGLVIDPILDGAKAVFLEELREDEMGEMDKVQAEFLFLLQEDC